MLSATTNMAQPLFSLTGRRVYVAGHTGMVGSAIVRRLRDLPCEIVVAGRDVVDLRRQKEVEDWMAEARPDVIFLAAATVGGIAANSSRPGQFIYDNLMIEANVIDAARMTGVRKLMLLGSSCVYPRAAPQPIPESALLTSELEESNQWYAVAKIAGIKMAQAYRRQYGCDFISVMPCNLYGRNDTYDLQASHVIPALLMKVHSAKVDDVRSVEVWGTGAPRREFLYVDDLADACVFAMEHFSDEAPLNAGSGSDISIRELAYLIRDVVGYTGELRFDSSKPDGTMRKLMDSSRLISLGWKPGTDLREGLARTFDAFLSENDARVGAALASAPLRRESPASCSQ